MEKWATPRQVLNAYHTFTYPDSINKSIYDYCNRYIGKWRGTSARCTAISPGSIQIEWQDGSSFWYSGDVMKWGDGYKLLKRDAAYD